MADKGIRQIYREYRDEELVKLSQNGDETAQEYLLDKYKSLVRMKSRAYFLIGADNEDIIQEGMIGLYKAVRDFSPERSTSFRSFAELCINRQMISAMSGRSHSYRSGHEPRIYPERYSGDLS